MLVANGENLLYRRPAPLPTQPQIAWGTGAGTVGVAAAEPAGVGTWLAVRETDAIRVVYTNTPTQGEAKLQRFVPATNQLTTLALLNNQTKNYVAFQPGPGDGRLQRAQTPTALVGLRKDNNLPHRNWLYVLPFDGSPPREVAVTGSETERFDLVTTFGERVYLRWLPETTAFVDAHLVAVDLDKGDAVTDFGAIPESKGVGFWAPSGGWAYADAAHVRLAFNKGSKMVRTYRIDVATKAVALESCMDGTFPATVFFGHPTSGIFTRQGSGNANVPWLEVAGPIGAGG